MPRPLSFPCLLTLYWVVSPLGNPVPYYTLQGLKCILEYLVPSYQLLELSVNG